MSNIYPKPRVEFKLLVCPETSYLKVDAYLNPDAVLKLKGIVTRQLYDVKLFEVTPSERGLSTGRFQRYDHEKKYPHTVHLHHTHGASLSSNSRLQGKRLGCLSEEIVEWIAANTYARWSLEVNLPHISACNMIWSFADPRDATMFKMVWG